MFDTDGEFIPEVRWKKNIMKKKLLTIRQAMVYKLKNVDKWEVAKIAELLKICKGTVTMHNNIALCKIRRWPTANKNLISSNFRRYIEEINDAHDCD